MIHWNNYKEVGEIHYLFLNKDIEKKDWKNELCHEITKN